MRLDQVDPTHKPHLFYPARDIGEVNTETLEPIYAYDEGEIEIDPVEFAQAIDALRVIKKKVFDGLAWFAFLDEKIQIYWQKDSEATPRLVAEAELIGQAFIGGQWRDATFSFVEANISQVENGVYRAVNRTARTASEFNPADYSSYFAVVQSDIWIAM